MAEDEASGLSGTQCPSCGIVVAFGYPRCPKCHAVMPSGERPGGPGPQSRPGTRPGGTSLAEEGGGIGVWIAVVGALAVVGGVALFLLRGDGDSPTPAESAKPAVEVVDEGGDEPGPVDNGSEIAPPSIESPAFADVEARGARNAMAAEIGGALDTKRLWAAVEVVELNLELSSAYCADDGLRAELEARAADLSSAGFERVLCKERHGALVFELDVAGLGGEPSADATDAGAD